MKFIQISFFGLVFLGIFGGFTLFQDKPQIKWMTIQEAVAANKENPKKIFFDVYTDWCGWCKRMDATTFQHPTVIGYINKNYYAVKFNAETTEEIKVNGKTYGSSAPGKPRAAHQFAVEMLQGQLSYPSFAVYNSDLSNIGIIPGFQTAKDLETILNFFGTDAHLTQPWDNYKNSFKNTVD